MSRGFLGLVKGNRGAALNANTKAFDGIARFAWMEHGIFLIHHQDGRWPQFVREFIRDRIEKKYGKRPV